MHELASEAESRSHVRPSTRLYLVYLSEEPIEQFSLVLMFQHYTEIWEKQVALHPVSNMIIKIIFQDTLEVGSSNNVTKKSGRAKLNFQIRLRLEKQT